MVHCHATGSRTCSWPVQLFAVKVLVGCSVAMPLGWQHCTMQHRANHRFPRWDGRWWQDGRCSCVCKDFFHACGEGRWHTLWPRMAWRIMMSYVVKIGPRTTCWAKCQVNHSGLERVNSSEAVDWVLKQMRREAPEMLKQTDHSGRRLKCPGVVGVLPL